jgi:phosphoribosylformylglycinamidine cyclo-ligase
MHILLDRKGIKMSKSFSKAYADAGVDITAGYEGVKLMKKHVDRTMIPGVVSDIGGFGGLFAPDLAGMKEPVFVSGTDGVGTKQRIAQLMNKFDTVGIDCVAMCVNDVICCGAKPLFFLDYIAIGKNVPEKVAELVSGVAEGCVQSGCALIGGETAEHPGMMAADDFDLAGFTVGLVDKEKILDNKRMEEGDIVLALPSSGVHSNGFSLVRKVFDIENADLDAAVDELGGKSLGETLLTPTVIYVKPVLAAIAAADVKGISHITGGGFYENIPRSIPDGYCAKIYKADVKVLPIFRYIQKTGDISEHDMFNTFNMGVGMCMTVSKETADAAIKALKANGIDAYQIGLITKGPEKVELC